MKKLILITCVMIAFLGAATVTTTANAQSKKKVSIDVNAKAVEKSRGANPNIKSGAPKVDNAVAKSRGDVCTVNFYNYTGLFIYVYVDGALKGSIAAYGSGTVSVATGYTTIYCVSSGGTQEWSAAGNCDEVYTYNLRYN